MGHEIDQDAPEDIFNHLYGNLAAWEGGKIKDGDENWKENGVLRPFSQWKILDELKESNP